MTDVKKRWLKFNSDMLATKIIPRLKYVALTLNFRWI